MEQADSLLRMEAILLHSQNRVAATMLGLLPPKSKTK